MKLHLLLLGSVFALGACGKDKGMSAEACQTQAAELTRLLADTPHEPTLLMSAPGIALVVRDDLEDADLELAPSLAIGAHTLEFQGESLELDELAERLAREQQLVAEARAYARIDPRRLYVQIDRDAPWGRVVTAVDAAAAAGFTAPAFAFASSARLTPPPRAPIDDRLDEILDHGDPSAKAALLAAEIETLVGQCPAIQRAFGQVASSGAASKADLLIAGLGPALVECGCAVDMPNLRSVMWRLLAALPAFRVIAFDATTRAETLSLPRATPWAEASRRLAPATRGLRLVAD